MLIAHIRAAIFAAVMIILAVTAGALPSARQAFAAVTQVERSDDELLILELHVNDTIRNKGLLGYLPDGATLDQTLLPISSLSHALSFAIKAKPQDGVAEGWYGTKSNVFRLDLNTKTVVVNGREMPLPDGAAEAHFEDIYVQISMLEKWFGLKIRPDISSLRLFVTWNHLFPFEEQKLREQRGQTLNQRHGDGNVVYNTDTLLPYQSWSQPSIVWQQSLQGSRSDGSSNASTSFSIQSQGDAFKFGTRFLMAGTTGTDDALRLNNTKLTFQKRDPNNALLGPLKAGKIEFGDINYPDVPLIVSRKRGRGVSVSSNSSLGVSHSYGLERYNVDGDAPIGWDAELYRNGYFVAFQQVGDDGRYNFENVDLIKGFNLFRVVLSGPEGQKVTETKLIARGPEMLKKGEVNYEFAAGQPEADFLPFAENSNTNSSPGASGRVFYGVKNNLTIGASIFSGSDLSSTEGNRVSAASFTGVTAFAGLKTQVELMKANEGRSAYNTDVSTRVLGANLSASHTAYQGFNKDDKDTLSVTSLDADKNFGFMSASLRAAKSKFQDKDDELSLNARVSTHLGRLQFTNTLERVSSPNTAQEKFDGNLAVATHIDTWRVRSNLDYDLDSRATENIRNVNISAYKKLTRKSTLRLNGMYNFINNSISSDVRYSKEFDKYSLDFNAGGSTLNSYYGGITFRTGFQPDNQGHYKMVSAREGGLGSVGLRAYLDENGNRKYDDGEKLLPNMGFRSNRGMIDERTDEKGSLFVNGLPEGPTRFSIDEASMPSIYLKPYKDYVDIIPRAGATTTIDIGFMQLGEIDGFVTMPDESGKQKPAAGLEVTLTDQKTGKEVSYVNSEYDGYYIFSAIPLGSYLIQVVPLWDTDHASMPSATVDVTVKKPVITDINITLPAQEQSTEKEDNDSADSSKSGVFNVIKDEPLPVITDGRDVSTGEELRGLFIHVGSLESFDGAQKERKRLWDKYPEILGTIPLYIYKIQVGEKTYFRVIGMVDNKTHGESLCAPLIEQNIAGGCKVVEL